MPAVQETVARVREIDVDKYKYGFVTDIELVQGPEGPERGHRPLHLGQEGRARVDARLAARGLSPLARPCRSRPGRTSHHPKIDFQDLYYYSAPKSTEGPKSLDEVDPELLETYEKLGIPLKEQEVLAGVEGARSKAAGRGRRRVR